MHRGLQNTYRRRKTYKKGNDKISSRRAAAHDTVYDGSFWRKDNVFKNVEPLLKKENDVH